ncbi:MAG: hypothetical protein WAO35_06810 [Terriglobia bacterium]
MAVLQEADQSVQVRGQQVFTADMQYDTLADLPAVAIILDQAEISVIPGLGLAWDHLQVFVRRSAVAGHVAGTKTESSKKPVPLDASLATAILRSQGMAHHVTDSDFVFAGESGNARWQGMILKEYIQPAAVKVGIQGKVKWHAFRHSYRAWHKRDSAPVKVQKELVLHSNLKTTFEIYGLGPGVTPQNRAAISRVVKLLLGA